MQDVGGERGAGHLREGNSQATVTATAGTVTASRDDPTPQGIMTQMITGILLNKQFTFFTGKFCLDD